MTTLYNCRVCGLTQDSPPWGDDGNTPEWEICPCCGTEFGYEDCSQDSVKRRREEWIRDGMKWFHEKEKPEDWDFDEQKNGIPKEFL